MKINLHFEDGPISADIEAEDDDEISDVLEELADFVNDYYKMVNGKSRGDRFDSGSNDSQATFDSIKEPDSTSENDSEFSEVSERNIDSPRTEYSTDPDKSSSDDSQIDSNGVSTDRDDSETSDADEVTDQEVDNAENSDYRPIIEETGLTESKLKKIIDCGDAERGPRILASNFLPGSSKQEKTLNGTVVLLTLWKSCHGVFWKNTVDIVEYLEKSGLKDERFKRIYNEDDWDTYLQKKGEKRGTELGIVPLGEDRGFELIEEMAKRAGV
jgi:hypothetical protein